MQLTQFTQYAHSVPTFVYPSLYFSFSSPTVSMMTWAILLSLFSSSRFEVAPGWITMAAFTPRMFRQPYLVLVQGIGQD